MSATHMDELIQPDFCKLIETYVEVNLEGHCDKRKHCNKKGCPACLERHWE